MLVPLCELDGVGSMIFTLRSGGLSAHSGEVSFPGGHVDPGESAAVSGCVHVPTAVQKLAAHLC